MSLAALPRLLRNEPALTQAIGSASGFVAVPEAARAISVAALAQLSDRAPLVGASGTYASGYKVLAVRAAIAALSDTVPA